MQISSFFFKGNSYSLFRESRKKRFPFEVNFPMPRRPLKDTCFGSSSLPGILFSRVSLLSSSFSSSSLHFDSFWICFSSFCLSLLLPFFSLSFLILFLFFIFFSLPSIFLYSIFSSLVFLFSVHLSHFLKSILSPSTLFFFCVSVLVPFISHFLFILQMSFSPSFFLLFFLSPIFHFSFCPFYPFLLLSTRSLSLRLLLISPCLLSFSFPSILLFSFDPSNILFFSFPSILLISFYPSHFLLCSSFPSILLISSPSLLYLSSIFPSILLFPFSHSKTSTNSL